MFCNVCDGYTFDLIKQGTIKVLLAHKLDNVRSNPYKWNPTTVICTCL